MCITTDLEAFFPSFNKLRRHLLSPPHPKFIRGASLSAIQKENGAIKDDFCVQKSPRNYLPSLCNCLRLNWSFQLLHLGYNLHDKQQGRHWPPPIFTSRSVCPRQRRQPAISIRLKTENSSPDTHHFHVPLVSLHF